MGDFKFLIEKEHVPSDKNFVIPDEEISLTDREVFTSSDRNCWEYVRLKDITKNRSIEANDFHPLNKHRKIG
jgi:hypothetical protein